MIKSILILGFLMVLWSCHKNGISSSKRLTSVSLYATQAHSRDRQTDSILYDNNNRMIECRRMSFDTSLNSGGFITNVSSNQTSFVFSYIGPDTLPSSYLIRYSYSSNTPQHILTYNNIKQVINDSDVQQITTVLLNSMYVSYAPNVIVAKIINPTGVSGIRIDSFILQNGNIISRYYKFPPQNSNNSVDQITYSTIPNPLYNFKSIGILLYEIFPNYFDYVSRNLFSNISNSNNVGNTSMIWSVDADGNAISGSGSASGSVAVQITFNYK